MQKKYIFGPVNSRRLGISLGVDLLPYKTCTFDCVYCECGLTTDLVTERKEYVNTEEVISELTKYLGGRPELDYITFSGSGEPTLHSGIGKILSFLKSNFAEYKTAVLTNSSLLYRDDVQDDLMKADLVVPSIDAVSNDVFLKILRPAPGITPEKVLDGLRNFSMRFSNRIVVEVFIVTGINDSPDEIARIRDYLSELNIDGIQLNSLDRPAPEEWVRPVDEERMNSIRDMFKPLIVQPVKRVHSDISPAILKNEIENTVAAVLRRRPSTLDDLVYAVGINKNIIMGHLERMQNDGIIIEKRGERGLFYRISRQK